MDSSMISAAHMTAPPSMQSQVHIQAITRSPVHTNVNGQMDVKAVVRRPTNERDPRDPRTTERTRFTANNLGRFGTGPDESPPPEPTSAPSQEPLSPDDDHDPHDIPLSGGHSQGHSPAGSSPKSHRRERSLSGDTYHAGTLYKTELCRSFTDNGFCRYGLKCRFAHGLNDLRPVARHKKYKTELCKNFARDGSCPYGPRCRFIHDGSDLELANKVRIAVGVVTPPLEHTATSSSPRIASLSRSQSAHVSGMADARHRSRTHPTTNTSLPQSPSFAFQAPFTSSPFSPPFSSPFPPPFVSNIDPLDLDVKQHRMERAPPVEEATVPYPNRRPISPLDIVVENNPPPFRPSSSTSEPTEPYAGRTAASAASAAGSGFSRRSLEAQPFQARGNGVAGGGGVGSNGYDSRAATAYPASAPSTATYTTRDDFDSYVPRGSARERDQRASVPSTYRTLNNSSSAPPTSTNTVIVNDPSRPRRTVSLENRNASDPTTIISRNTTPYTTLTAAAFSLSPVTLPADAPVEISDNMSLTAAVQSADVASDKSLSIAGSTRSSASISASSAGGGTDIIADDLNVGASVSASTSSYVLSREPTPDIDKSLNQISAPAPVRSAHVLNNIREGTHSQLSPRPAGLRHNSREDVRRQRSPVFADEPTAGKMSSRNPSAATSASQAKRRSGTYEEDGFSLSSRSPGGVGYNEFTAAAQLAADATDLSHSMSQMNLTNSSVSASSRRSYDHPTSPLSTSSPVSLRDSYSSVSSSISLPSTVSNSSASSSPHSLSSQSPLAYPRGSGSHPRSPADRNQAKSAGGVPISPINHSMSEPVSTDGVGVAPTTSARQQRSAPPPGFTPYPKELATT